MTTNESKPVDVGLVLSRARTLLDSINHWDGEDEAERVAVINAIDDAIDVVEPTPPVWEPVVLDPKTELDKAMANLRAALKFDNDAREVPENGTGIKRDAHQWLREAADEAVEAHEALHHFKAAEAMATSMARSEPEHNWPTVVLVGNPVDGLTMYGPFRLAADAVDWCDRLNNIGGDYWMTKLCPPESWRDDLDDGEDDGGDHVD